jgi:hypothetical protein
VTRAEQLSEALKLLAPPPSKRENCRRDIECMLDRIDSTSRAVKTHKEFTSKRGRPSLRRYAKALRQLRDAHNALPALIKPWFSLAETAYVVGEPTVIDRELAKVEPLLAKSVPPKRDAVRVRAAVEAAYILLCLWGYKASLTRNGKWERLAKVPVDGAYVFEHMRAFKRSKRKPVVAKLKGKDGTALVVVRKPPPSSE